MLKNTCSPLAIISSFIILTTRFAAAQNTNAPGTGLYQIISGSYIECCGFAGDVQFPLPNDQQAFIQLTIDPETRLATLTFLGSDMLPFSRTLSCPSGEHILFSFDHGFALSNQFEFHADPGPAPLFKYWNYSVSNSVAGLRIDGMVGISPQSCIDVPTHFSHTNVLAVPIPRPTIRVSEVEICWNAASNTTYRVQYRSAMTTNAWTNLGPLIFGNGSTNCIHDPVAPGEPRRFYRVLVVP